MSVLTPHQNIKIFFSYNFSSREDSALFKRLMTHISILERQYHLLQMHNSAADPGSTITPFIEARLREANIIVFLLSADFLASERCYTRELQRGFTLATTRATRLIFVRLGPIDWEAFPLDQYTTLPSDGKPITLWSNRAAAYAEVTKGIRLAINDFLSQPVQTLPSEFQRSPICNVPYSTNELFTNRTEILNTITSSFTTFGTQHTPIVALSGLSGIGKTQIALAYSHREAQQYSNTIWLNASSQNVLYAQVKAIADKFPLPIEEREQEQKLFAAFQRWLRDQSNWLLVLDQIEDVTLIDLIVPPHSSGHVLLTTRNQAIGKRGTAVFVKSMHSDASVQFLLRRAKKLTPDVNFADPTTQVVRDAAVIAQELDNFPLALDQAGAYLEEKGCSLTTYLSLYRRQRARLLKERGRLADAYRESTASTLELAFKQATQNQPQNLELLHLLAFLQPDIIPEGLLLLDSDEARALLPSFADDPFALQQAIDDLRRFSLVHYNANGSILNIQRIVQHVLIDRLSVEQQRHQAQLVVHLITSVFPEGRFESLETWSESELYLPQAEQAATLIQQYELSSHESALLLERLGRYCLERAAYAAAETYLTHARALYEHSLGTYPLDTAQTLNSLALLYQQQARYEDAEALHQQALKIREGVLDPNDPKLAESLHNLAMVYSEQEQYQQALPLSLRALALEEQAKGPDHPDVATTLNEIGLLHYQQGHYSAAQTAYNRALAIFERALSPEHPGLTATLNNMGALAQKIGNYQQAEKLYQRTLTIRQQALGEKHPDVARSINKLAGIIELQGNYTRAEELYEQALHIFEQAFGPDHPDVARVLNNQALLTSRQGHYQQAEQRYQRALAIYEHVYGSEHSTVASVLNNLGQLYRKLGDHAHAESFLRQSLTIRERVSGGSHPQTAQSLSNLADLLAARQTYEEAEALFKRAYAIRLQAFGPEHTEVVLTREKYASLLEKLNRNEEAIALRQATEKQEERLPEVSQDGV